MDTRVEPAYDIVMQNRVRSSTASATPASAAFSDKSKSSVSER
jgi:hypothetical protein